MVREPGGFARRHAAQVGRACIRAALALLLPAVAQPQAARPSALAARGYTALPAPRQVELQANDISFGADWRVEAGPGVAPGDIALVALQEEMVNRFQMQLQPGGGAGVLRLTIQPGSVAVGDSRDRDQAALAEQAYRIDLAPGVVRITANAGTGLFYGVETLAQLLQRGNGRDLKLPAGRIVDWPDLQFRAILWDDSYRLEQPFYLMNAMRQAAAFKINAFLLRLDGHFLYKSAPAAAEPNALSPADLQQLTDFGLRYHIQLIPCFSAPGDAAFLLKHPEYAALRAFPRSNHQLAALIPGSLALLNGMFADLLEANRGVKYFYLATGDPDWIGQAASAADNEAARAKELGSAGKLLAEFLGKAAAVPNGQGRTVLFGGATPLTPDDVPALPGGLVSAETHGPALDAALQARGIRETIHVSLLGAGRLFPSYFALPESGRVHSAPAQAPRVEEGMHEIASSAAGRLGGLMGAVVAASGGAGMHPETFWLGYAGIASAAWNPNANSSEALDAFLRVSYGDRTVNIPRVFELMSRQAQFYAESWDDAAPPARAAAPGDAPVTADTPRPVSDQTLPLPPPPSGPDLSRASTWTRDNTRRVLLASEQLAENTELLGLLDRNLPLASIGYSQYNLSVFQSIGEICRQNLDLLRDLGKIDGLLDSAAENARDGNAQDAVTALDQALQAAVATRASRNAVLNAAENAWDRVWFPRVPMANGRRFLQQPDEARNAPADRTGDLSYLIYRELSLPFQAWFDQVQTVRNEYAQAHGIAARRLPFDWSNPSVR